MTTEPVDPVPPAEPSPLPPPVEPDRPVIETRPELLVGAAAAGGFVLAKVLRALRGV
ncbi:MAG TPA: hypothetical protein PKD63_09590 [Solirubrobacteraceae bacterium]|nr:hypothetical protein [Solirubrobacteraceae bacterium]